MPFIIYGTRGITSTTDNGEFHCPRCGPSLYAQKRVRRFFTLYWIPLIPLNTLATYVECETCAGTYDPEVLDFNPEAGKAEFLSKLDQASRRLMALMVLADGEIDDEEIGAMVSISESLPGGDLTEEEARAEVAIAAEGSKEIIPYVIDIRDDLNDSGKVLLLRVALAVAMADGDFADEEKLLLLQIGEALGMDGDQVLEMLHAGPEA